MGQIEHLPGAHIMVIARAIDSDMNWEDLDWLIDEFSERHNIKGLNESPLDMPRTRDRLKKFKLLDALLFLAELASGNPQVYGAIHKQMTQLYPTENSDINTVIEKFSSYPEVSKLWKKSNDYLLNGELRESLDNARLSLELYFKALFNNQKSLENQKSEIGSLLVNQPKQFRDLFISHVRSYEVLQNQKVKHNLADGLEEEEIRYILNTTYLLMSYMEKTND